MITARKICRSLLAIAMIMALLVAAAPLSAMPAPAYDGTITIESPTKVSPVYARTDCDIVTVEYSASPKSYDRNVRALVFKPGISIGSDESVLPSGAESGYCEVWLEPHANDGPYDVQVEIRGEEIKDIQINAVIVDNVAPDGASWMSPKSGSRVRPRTDQPVKAQVHDEVQTNGEIILHYKSESLDGTQVLLGESGIGDTTYGGNIDTTGVPAETEEKLKLWITGTDKAGNAIPTSVGGSEDWPLCHLLIDNTLPELEIIEIRDTATGFLGYSNGDTEIIVCSNKALAEKPVVVISPPWADDDDITDSGVSYSPPSSTWNQCWKYTYKVNTECEHTVRASAKDIAGTPCEAESSFFGDLTPPQPIEDLKAHVQTHVIRTSWSPSYDEVSIHPSGLSHYRVYRTTTPGGPYDLVKDDVTDIFYDDPYGVPKTPYYYVVKPVDMVGNEGESNEATATFPKPSPRPEMEHSIPLTVGWNLISLPLIPTNSDITEVLNPIAGKYEEVWSYQQGSWCYHNGSAPVGICDLTTMEEGWGYLILMKEGTELLVKGYEMPPIAGGNVPTARPLQKGWNLIGFKTLDVNKDGELTDDDTMLADYYLQGLDGLPSNLWWGGNGLIVGEEVLYLRYWDLMTNGWVEVTGTDEMKVGSGYWLYLNSTDNGELVPPIQS